MRNILLLSLLLCLPAAGQQSVALSGGGKRFDGIGVVNGGGATSVLLKDYPEPQRSQILDMVYKPMFGASVSAMLVEVPGDGNSTQGSMPSYAHTRGDIGHWRGYTWWAMREAKRRNPALSLDAAAWSAPHWVGDGNFWSDDAADYYIGWLQGMRDIHGLTLDAIGCRNEKGESFQFVKTLRRRLDESGFGNVRVHAFDNWYKGKLDFVRHFASDPQLQSAVDIVSGHTFYEGQPVPPDIRHICDSIGKPLWNTEDHVYLPGFDCLIGIVRCFNHNYIKSGVTRITNWYDIGGLYAMEPYSTDPPMILAHEPWSGHFAIRQNLWGYAHYGQFTRIGWHYIDSACRMLDGGGSMVALRSDGGDYSIIVETRDATKPQTLRLRPGKGLSRAKLCVWRSDSTEQFVCDGEIGPRATITLRPHTVYSLSTLRGQRKGHYDAPPSKPFPMPYSDDFDGYAEPDSCGWLPRYTADISGAFELCKRPDGRGMCIKQSAQWPINEWAPAWKPYTIIGDSQWQDYDVSADAMCGNESAAGVMGRLCDVGFGWGYIPKGYYLALAGSGLCRIVVVRGKIDKEAIEGDAEQQAIIKAGKDKGKGGELTLAEARIEGIAPGTWHNLRLSFRGSHIEGYVDGKKALEADDSHYRKGMAGMIADGKARAWFDNLRIAKN